MSATKHTTITTVKKPTVKFRLCLPTLEDAYLDEMKVRETLELE